MLPHSDIASPGREHKQDISLTPGEMRRRLLWSEWERSIHSAKHPERRHTYLHTYMHIRLWVYTTKIHNGIYSPIFCVYQHYRNANLLVKIILAHLPIPRTYMCIG